MHHRFWPLMILEAGKFEKLSSPSAMPFIVVFIFQGWQRSSASGVGPLLGTSNNKSCSELMAENCIGVEGDAKRLLGLKQSTSLSTNSSMQETALEFVSLLFRFGGFADATFTTPALLILLGLLMTPFVSEISHYERPHR